MTNTISNLPVLFVPHGGGPLPLMNDPAHKELIRALKSLPKTFDQPRAILVISAHWEAKKVLVSSHPHPSMLFDYYGFPPETYDYRYPALGNSALAQECLDGLISAGIDAALDGERGFDHGTFVPLMLMYPKANIPVIQVSLHHSLDAQQHIAIGLAIARLREQAVLILGSGMSFHNMNAFFNASVAARNASEVFDTWLVEQLCRDEKQFDVATNAQRRIVSLEQWARAPSARFCHPREEHLLPLLVCLGAAQGETATQFFSDHLMQMRVSGFRWD